MTSFDAMGLPEALLHKLNHIQFTTPTPIQSEAIPLALQGHDILGTAQTGTGKTGAFGIPLIAHLLNNPSQSALVIAPTRELASQILQQLQAMIAVKSPLQSALLIGGDSINKQLQQLRKKPSIIVGTPGRINDHLKRKSLYLKNTHYIVLDETDRMLDMGFSVQIDVIMKHIPDERQTLLFSATLPKNIERIAAQYLREPTRIAVSPTSSPANNITQEVIKVTDKEKYSTLLKELQKREGSVIIFVKTKFSTERLAKRLSEAGHSAEAIHGDLRQRNRDNVINAFRRQKYRVLVATDIAARGLDIPHIEHVINYDLPQCPEDYIHRIGRTARAGNEGAALNLVTPTDGRKWHAIECLLDPEKKPSKNTGFKSKGRGNKKPSRYSKGPRDSGKSYRDSDKGSRDGGKNYRDSDKSSRDGGKNYRDSDKGSRDGGKNYRDSDKGSRDGGKNYRDSDKGSRDGGKNYRDSDKGSRDGGKNYRDSDKGSRDGGKNYRDSDKGSRDGGTNYRDGSKGPRDKNGPKRSFKKSA